MDGEVKSEKEKVESGTEMAAAPEPSHKFRTLLLVVLALLLVGGAGAGYWYFTIYTQTPERTMARMFGAMQGVTAVTADVTVDGNGTGIPTSSLYVDKENPFTKAVDSSLLVKALLHIDDAAKLFDMDFSLSAKADGNEVSAFAGEMRSIGDVDYVQFTTLATLAIPATVMDGVSVALNRFIVIDKTEIMKSFRIDALATSVDTTQEAAVRTALAEYLPKIIVVTSTLPIEGVQGVDTLHYAYAVDKNAVGELLNALSVTMPDHDFSEVRAMLGNTNDVTGELWIGKRDALLYKATIMTTLKGTQQFAVTATVGLSDFGAAVAVVAPEASTPFQDVMVEVLEKVSEIGNADDDGDGLNNRDEDKYGSDKNTPDTDGDGFSDGDEVKNGYNPAGDGKISVTVTSTSIVNSDGSASFVD
ncbi:MAG: hypothetical protein AAB663_03410 [Patescibacteria group bacterium]